MYSGQKQNSMHMEKVKHILPQPKQILQDAKTI